jgi:tetratricopeptide (TPR) repeat protein
MFAKHALGLVIMATPLISASIAGAGWGWGVDNVATKGPSLTGGGIDGDKAFDAASRAVHEGKDAEALTLIRAAVASRPSGPPVRLELARLQFAANQAAKGRRSLEQTASESPNDPRVYLMFGSLALGEGRYSDARLNGEKALALLDETKLDAGAVRAIRREASAGLAAVAEASDDWSSARTHLLDWLDIDPANAQARQRLGRALFRLGETEGAFKELTRAAKDDPKLGPAAVPMALLFVQAGNDAKAEEWFVHASRVEPKNAVVRLTHARWRLDKGRAIEARSLVEEAAKLDPKSKEVEPLRGLVAWQLRELDAAERIFEALHRAAPADSGFASLLTLALVEQDDAEKRSQGLRLAEVNAQKFPRALDVLASLGRAHARSGHREEAERFLRAAIAGAGGRATPTIAYFLAQILAEKGLPDDARGLLTQATATPIAFAYQADARKLLATLEAKTPARAALPLTSHP